MYKAAIVNREPVILDMDNSPSEAINIDDAKWMARALNVELQEDIKNIYELINNCRSDLIYDANPWPYGVENPDCELVKAYEVIQEAVSKLDEAKNILWGYRCKLSWEITTK